MLCDDEPCIVGDPRVWRIFASRPMARSLSTSPIYRFKKKKNRVEIRARINEPPYVHTEGFREEGGCVSDSKDGKVFIQQLSVVVSVLNHLILNHS
jgi:hypothetical protein